MGVRHPPEPGPHGREPERADARPRRRSGCLRRHAPWRETMRASCASRSCRRTARSCGERRSSASVEHANSGESDDPRVRPRRKSMPPCGLTDPTTSNAVPGHYAATPGSGRACRPERADPARAWGLMLCRPDARLSLSRGSKFSTAYMRLRSLMCCERERAGSSGRLVDPVDGLSVLRGGARRTGSAGCIDLAVKCLGR